MRKKHIVIACFFATIMLLIPFTSVTSSVNNKLIRETKDDEPLVPSISSVNANIQNKNNLNIKNIDVEDIKRIKNRILNNDCNCQKPNDQNNDKGVVINILCETLLMIVLAICSPLLLFELYGDIDNEILVRLVQLLSAFLLPIATPFVLMAMYLNCDWTEPYSTIAR